MSKQEEYNRSRDEFLNKIENNKYTKKLFYFVEENAKHIYVKRNDSLFIIGYTSYTNSKLTDEEKRKLFGNFKSLIQQIPYMMYNDFTEDSFDSKRVLKARPYIDVTLQMDNYFDVDTYHEFKTLVVLKKML